MKTEFGTLIKSDNALFAEDNGRFPATMLCKKLRLPAEIVDYLPWDGEWHHVSSFANKVNYYNLARVREWLATEEGQLALKEAKAEKKAKADKALEVVHTDVVVVSQEYRTEWSKRGRPFSVPVERKYAVAELRTHPKKVMVELVLKNGDFMKKSKKNLRVYKDNVWVNL